MKQCAAAFEDAWVGEIARTLSLLFGVEPTREPICHNVSANNTATHIRLAATNDRRPPDGSKAESQSSLMPLPVFHQKET